MYQLYYSPGACSMSVHVVLNELALPFELKRINLQEGEGQSAAFLMVNPRGQVPVLVDSSKAIREGGAIILYLLDEYKSILLPRSGMIRAAALEWLMFANATMHPAYSRAFFIMKNVADPVARDLLLKIVIDQINKLWDDVDNVLGKSRYITGKDITAADIMLTVIANWGGYLPQQPVLGNNIRRMLREVIARPSFAKALKAEQVEYKAATA